MRIRTAQVRNIGTLTAAAASLLAAGTANAELVIGVTAQQRLVSFDTATPGTIISGFAISGLASNEQISGIDPRPNDGFLYGLGSQNNLYRLNPANGAATLVAPLNTALNGASFGFDFNPTGPVALRIVSNTDKNYRLGAPATSGVVNTDIDLAYVAGDPNFGVNPNITHVAYSNNVPGATSTALFAIDAGTDTLVRITTPNSGTLSTIGTLGMGSNANVNAIGGFDISGATGLAFAATQNVSQFQSILWGIDLVTGAGTNLGSIGGGETIVAMTIVPTPATASILALGVIALGRRRR